MARSRRSFRFWRNIPAEVDEELRYHLDARSQENIAAGMPPDAARQAALERFGDLERVRDDCEVIDQELDHDRRRTRMWESIGQDFRYALRALSRSPGFTAIAVLTLALGIGANTAVFSVVNGVLLRPLAYPKPDRLVRLFTAFKGSGNDRYSMSQPEFMDYRSVTTSFINAAAFTGAGLTLTGNGEPERVRGITATPDLLPVLGLVPFRGRNFEANEGRQGIEPVVILAYEYWKSRFASDESLLGKTLTFNGINRRVVGILPPGGTLDRAQAIIPLYINPDSLSGRSSNYLSGVARLRDGVSIERAQRELDVLTTRSNQVYASTYPADMGYAATVISMRDEMVGDIRPALLLLLGAVGLVLLIACANVANLLLARGEARQREIAVRQAIGAGRQRIVRQLLTESATLALMGSLLGIAFAWWGTKAILAISGSTIPRVQEVRIDLTVGLVTLGLSILTGLLFGLAPALQLTRSDLQSTIREGSRGGSTGAGQQALGRSLVIGEIALAVVVVIGAALLVRSFNALRGVDPGFRTDHLLAVDLSIPSSRYDTPQATAFYREILIQLGSLPGVQAVAAASELPPAADGNNWDILVEGRSRGKDETLASPNVRFVTNDYFTTLSIPIAKGRGFTAEDHEGSVPVIIVNEALAADVWPGQDPLGQRVRFSQNQPWLTVIGISRNVHSEGFAQPAPIELYLLHAQLPVIAGGAARTMFVVMRTGTDPLTLAAPARTVIHSMDPLLAITNIRSMDELVAASIAGPRFTMTLLSAFGASALLLAAIGIYGLMAYGVRRRTREIGIRMALGARQSEVLRLVVRQGMRLALLGLMVGVLAAFLLTRLMSRMLFGISPSDPVTYIAIALLLAGVSFIATWIPARRAVRTDPCVALRGE